MKDGAALDGALLYFLLLVYIFKCGASFLPLKSTSGRVGSEKNQFPKTANFVAVS